jgi:phosphohistidine phosphatase
MKELLVIRHGKSSWSDPSWSDRERPLKERGRDAAQAMGQRLANRSAVPERIVTADARRALDTATILASAAGVGDDTIVVEPQLYTESPPKVLAVVQRLDDAISRAAVVGHNPALHELLHTVSDLRLGKYPTAAVAHLRWPVERWRDVAGASAEVVDYDWPKSGRS